MSASLPEPVLRLLRGAGLDTAPAEELRGGVSSEIWKVGDVCVKRALARLRVAQRWEAPVERNRYERLWLEAAGAAVPGAAPRILASDDRAGVFAMQYLAAPVWKERLRQGDARPAFAAQVGTTLAAIHSATAGRAEVAERFATDAIFYSIRLEPYLVATGEKHQDLKKDFSFLVRRTAETKLCLVHGDVSPKNILVGERGPVFLDAECAWYGDPAFDLAFCLNHLLLKCLWTPAARAAFLECFDALSAAYLQNVSFPEVEKRTASLLPALLLARVDGKSPVEYLTDDQRSVVRNIARSVIGQVSTLRDLKERMAKILDVKGRQVWDSRGRPTVEAEVIVGRGTTPLAMGRAIAPAGASTGAGEAMTVEPRKAVHNIQTRIRDGLRALSVSDQAKLDERLIELDGTSDKSRLGANAMVAVSLACAHADAAAEKIPLWKKFSGEKRVGLPVPQIQIFGGGAHARGRCDVQDYMIICVGAGSFAEALEWTSQVYAAAGKRLAKRNALQGVADEGGYWPAFKSNEEGLAELVGAISDAGLEPGADVAIALDIAASQLYRGGSYQLALENRSLSAEQMHAMLLRWIERYPIVSIEDPFAETDHAAMQAFTRATKIQVVGDDYFVTDAEKVKAANGACNTVLLKPNQVGTVTETLACWDAARAANYRAIVSARSGETEDVSIVHLAVGWGVPQLKVGSFSRSERMAKWNEALRIEEALGAKALPFPARKLFK